jgi:hypothetical protein
VRRGASATIDLTEASAESGLAVRNGRRQRIHSDSAMPAVLNGALAALTVAALSLAVVLGVTVIGWVLAADHSSLGAMFDVVILGWLSVHLVPISTAGGWLWLPPLVLTVGVGWLSHRVGTTSLRRGRFADLATRSRVVVAAALTYAMVATLLAWLGDGSGAQAPLWLVPLATAAVFSVGFAPVILLTTGRRQLIRERVPEMYLKECRAAIKGLAVLGAGAGVLLVGSLLISWEQLQEMAADLRPGFSGTLVLLLGSLVYLPTAIVWVASFLAGAGVSLGQESAASPFGVDVGELPAFPLLAAAPQETHWWYVLGLALPLAAGLVTARAAASSTETQSARDLAPPRLRAAAMAAALAGAAGILTHGTLGGRLADVGPNPLLLALMVLGCFLAGALLAAGLERFGFVARPGRTGLRRRPSRNQVVIPAPDAQKAPQSDNPPTSWSLDRTVVLDEEHAPDLGH